MQNDRLRIPVSDDYAQALGRAAYCFASCEWAVVWCWERLEDNALHDATGTPGKGMTAGVIARRFADAVDRMTETPQRAELQRLAAEFKRLVDERNSLLHGKPHTSPQGWHGLYSREREWSITDIEQAADQFAACGIALNDMHFDFLKAYQGERQRG